MENLPGTPNKSTGTQHGPVITHGSTGNGNNQGSSQGNNQGTNPQSSNPAYRSSEDNNRRDSNNNNWSDIEHSLAAKAREMESRSRECIVQAPFKSVLAASTFGMLVGLCLSRLRA